ncbi:N-6 DNA methylase [Streptomonospora salina]
MTAVAEAACSAWQSAFAGPDSRVPLSVVAALSLVDHGDPADVIGADDAEVAQLIGHLWSSFCRLRPDLAYRVMSLLEWSPGRRVGADEHRGAAAVARAAVDAGILDMGASGALQEEDVLGPLVSMLRPPSALQRTGTFFTPADVADLMAATTLGEGRIPAGSSIADEAAGTGGLLLAAARHLRRRGIEPATMRWAAADIDPLIAACLAVNVHRWGLGPRVLIGCADTLAHDWVEQASHERDLGLGIARNTGILAALRGFGAAA